MVAARQSRYGGSMTNRYRVILADDHVLVRQGLRRILEENPALEIKGEVGDGLELLSLLNREKTDLVILDVSMPNLRGIEMRAFSDLNNYETMVFEAVKKRIRIKQYLLKLLLV